jgi:predicted DNA-binding protein (UPF0251 family)
MFCKAKLQVLGRNHKKALIPIAEHKFLAIRLQETHQLDMAMSCKILCISRTAYYNQPKLTDDKNLDTLTRHKAISAT